ncbi:MAG: hypothetical protein QOF33_3775 [Thermomicrobiales bacterium]|jgi:predicted ATPase|nr:hypothetical protein [Thermomicrobiales bacterium]
MTPESEFGGEDVPPPLLLHLVTIRRFRSLFDIGPLPIQEALTVLTGENDGGKTTCLDAVAFLLAPQSLDAQDRSRWATDEDAIEVEGVFYSIDDPEHFDPMCIKVRLEPGGHRECLVLVRAHAQFGPQLGKIPINLLKEQMTAVGIPLPGGTAKLPYIEAVTEWLMTRPSEEWADTWCLASKTILNRLPRLTRFSAAEAQSPTRTIQRVVAREGQKRIEQPEFSGPLTQLGNKLDADVAASIEGIKNMIRQHSPDLDDVKVSAAFDFSKPDTNVRVEVCREGEWSDLDKGGEGRRRRVTLAVHEAISHLMEDEDSSARTDVFIYDEPDTHLDFRAQRTLFDVLDRQARRGHVQVLAATHSKNFIDMVPPKAILHFRLGGDQRTRVETLTVTGHEAELAFQAGILESLGLRNSMLLDERCFIVVEGETEEAAIPVLFPMVTGKSLVPSAVHLINTRGNRSMRQFILALKNQLKRDVVYLADTEADNEETQRRSRWLTELGLEAGRGAHFIGTTEFEDAFSDEVWLRALQTGFAPVEGQAAWSQADLTAFRTSPKFSAALHREVCRRCKDHSIGKPDLGMALAQTCTSVDDVPPVLRECFSEALKITGRWSVFRIAELAEAA